jgi:hypothetical protein
LSSGRTAAGCWQEKPLVGSSNPNPPRQLATVCARTEHTAPTCTHCRNNQRRFPPPTPDPPPRYPTPPLVISQRPSYPVQSASLGGVCVCVCVCVGVLPVARLVDKWSAQFWFYYLTSIHSSCSGRAKSGIQAPLLGGEKTSRIFFPLPAVRFAVLNVVLLVFLWGRMTVIFGLPCCVCVGVASAAARVHRSLALLTHAAVSSTH